MSEENTISRDKVLNWQIISKYRNLLFGVAILWIMLLHSLNYPVIDKWKGFKEYSLLHSIYQLVDLGGAGVDIFLFLSGIGLYYSFSKCSDLKLFYKKRLKRVLIPYLIIGVGNWVIRDIVYGLNPDGLLEDVFWVTFYTEGKSTYWYIIFILSMYLIYPLVYYMLESKHRNLNLAVLLFLAFGLIYIMYTRDYETYRNIEKAVSRIPIFLVGCYWGQMVKSRKPMHEGWVIYALIVPWIGGFFQYFGKNGGLPWKVTSRMWYGMMAIGVCILFSLLFSITELGIVGKFLNLAGTLSLELYLIHIAMKGLLKLWRPDYKQWGVGQTCLAYFLVVMVGSLLISILYHYVSQRISGIIQRKRKE